VVPELDLAPRDERTKSSSTSTCAGPLTFKAELGETFESIRHGKNAAFDDIEVFHNQRRRHSSTGYIAWATRERNYCAALAKPMARAA